VYIIKEVQCFGGAFIILQYEFGLPRAFVLTSTTEISESDASASPFSPKFLGLSSPSSITLWNLDVAVMAEANYKSFTQLESQLSIFILSKPTHVSGNGPILN